MKPVLVVGATGALGSAFCHELDKGSVNFYYTSRNSIPIGSKCLSLDRIISTNSLSDFSAIIYLAQSRKYKNLPQGLPDIAKVNTYLPTRLAELASLANAKFVYASSGSVYQASNDILCEDTSLILDGNNLNAYTSSKLFAEKMIAEVCAESLILRPFYVFGNKAQSPALFPSLISNISQNKEVRLAANIGIFLNPVAAETASSQIMHLLKIGAAGVFNLAGNQEVSLFEISQWIASYLDRDLIYSNAGNPSRVVASTEKLESTHFNFSDFQTDLLKEYLVRACEVELLQR